MKKIYTLFLVVLCLLFFVSCGSKSLKDGSYVGTYKGENTQMTVNFEINSGEYTNVTMTVLDKAGNPKDENYGKSAGDLAYEQAQHSVKQMAGYPALLEEVQNIDDVDVISGATQSWKEFQEAVKSAKLIED